MLAPVLLAALLASGPSPDAGALRHELYDLAARIEALKERRLAGEDVEGELEPLLVRSQELAVELERLRPGASAPPAGGSPEESAHERADELVERVNLLRDEADRLRRRCAVLDARILAALRSATSAPAQAGGGAPYASPAWAASDDDGAAPASPASKRSLVTAIASLVDQRMQLAIRARVLEAQAARLELEAQALENGAQGRATGAPAEPAEPPSR
ncbi:MAG TPA: hypothetical protein VMU15_01385 [Anaeromyxobacter sp.]|nr:hypothetical protein [Anaeromyxobacter sp.]